MGILWTVWPLDDQMKSWLDDLGIDYPNENSRFPTGIEIKGSLTQLNGYSVELNDNVPGAIFQARISKRNPDEWTTLVVTKFSGDDEEQKLWFEKGHESLILRVLKLLARETGPLALIADVGGRPSVVLRSGEVIGGD